MSVPVVDLLNSSDEEIVPVNPSADQPAPFDDAIDVDEIQPASPSVRRYREDNSTAHRHLVIPRNLMSSFEDSGDSVAFVSQTEACGTHATAAVDSGYAVSSVGGRSNAVEYTDNAGVTKSPSSIRKDNSPFKFIKEKGLFRISPMKYVKDFEVAPEIPVVFKTHPEGFATLLTTKQLGNLNTTMPLLPSGEMFKDRVSHVGPYSATFESPKNSSIIINNVKYEVERRSGKCSGVMCCRYSLFEASVGHNAESSNPFGKFVQRNLERETSETDEVLHLVTNILFFGNINFPSTLRCCGLDYTERDGSIKWDEIARRAPNWKKLSRTALRSRHGDHTAPTMSGKNRDYLVCQHFGERGHKDVKLCALTPIPVELYKSDESVLERVMEDARHGVFPNPAPWTLGQCAPKQVKNCEHYCTSDVHMFEPVPMDKIECDVTFILYVHYENGVPDFAVVVGYGTHTHSTPLPRASSEIVDCVAKELVQRSATATTESISREVFRRTGLNTTYGSARKARYNARARIPGSQYGKGLMALLREFLNNENCSTPEYLVYVSDPSIERADSEVGLNVIMCNKNLLKKSISKPNYGVDGTFNMVTRTAEGHKFELVSVMAKDDSGYFYAVMRQFTARATAASRRFLFEHFFSKAKSLGMKDPLHSAPYERMTMTSDFETGFAKAVGEALCKVYHGSYLSESFSHAYIKLTCYGCHFHAAKMVLEKTGTTPANKKLFSWCMATRSVEEERDVQLVVQQMQMLGGKWVGFGGWFTNNEIVRILWFTDLYKSDNSFMRRHVFWTTNGIEGMHNRLKQGDSYCLAKRAGRDICDARFIVFKVDENDAHFLSGDHVASRMRTPRFRRAARNVRDSPSRRDQYFTVNGVRTTISEPMSARRPPASEERSAKRGRR